MRRIQSLSVLAVTGCGILCSTSASAAVLQFLGFQTGGTVNNTTQFTNGLDDQVSDTQTLTDTEFNIPVTMTLAAVETDPSDTRPEQFGVNATGAGVDLNAGGPDRPFFNEIGEIFTISFDAPGVLDDIRSVAGTSNTGDIVTVTNLTTNVSQSAEVLGNNGQVQSLPFSLAFSAGDLLQVETSSTTNTTADWQIRRIDITVIPEPGSLGLLGLGALALVARQRNSDAS
ncbi:MAG: PEP-CTERM sorting domain-containing protein [Planctomycetota bacterium]